MRRTELRPEYEGKQHEYDCGSEDEQESMGVIAAPSFLYIQGRGGNHDCRTKCKHRVVIVVVTFEVKNISSILPCAC